MGFACMSDINNNAEGTVVLLATNAEHSQNIAGQLSGFLKAGDVIGLVGTLGAGKTTFTQGLANGLGVPDGVYVNSPTYTIINEYPTVPRMYHLDFYRLSDSSELIETGYDDILGQSAICVIEWFDTMPEAWPEEFLRIDFAETDSGRELKFTLRGKSWLDRIEQLESLK